MKPCGTRAAYMRHLRRSEDPCDLCIEAVAEDARKYRAAKPRRPACRKAGAANAAEREMDAALEARPPQITWIPNGRGVMVATSVDDPHTEKPQSLERRANQALYYAQRKSA